MGAVAGGTAGRAPWKEPPKDADRRPLGPGATEGPRVSGVKGRYVDYELMDMDAMLAPTLTDMRVK